MSVSCGTAQGTMCYPRNTADLRSISQISPSEPPIRGSYHSHISREPPRDSSIMLPADPRRSTFASKSPFWARTDATSTPPPTLTHPPTQRFTGGATNSHDVTNTLDAARARRNRRRRPFSQPPTLGTSNRPPPPNSRPVALKTSATGSTEHI